jgi:RNA polymerase sigma factor for flagellar operon FliA
MRTPEAFKVLLSPPDDAGPPAKVDVETLVTENLPLVGHIARELAVRIPRHLDTDDLNGAGALALVQAAQSFDPTLGVPFARFAALRVKGAMIDQMRSRDWATRSVRSRARALGVLTEQLTFALSRSPTEAELAAAGGMSEAEVRAVREDTDRASLLSLDPLATGEEGLAHTLEDSSPRPDEALVAAERLSYLRAAITELPDRTRFVVAGYYLQSRPLTDLAEELGVTQSRASQLRSEGLDLLKQALGTLLEDQRPVEESGVRARRREAYVAAVAQRSRARDRVAMQAYQDGAGVAQAKAAVRNGGIPTQQSLPATGTSPVGSR